MIEERLTLISQWFDTWDEFYRMKCLDLILAKCSTNLLQYVKYEATKKLRFAPSTQVVDSRQDFTRNLPRHLCLKILSFLDPRSLCRCAQVCWYWKYLSESDEIWEAKCNKLGWMFDSSAKFELNQWKNWYKTKLSKIRALSTIDDQPEPIIESPPDTITDSSKDKLNENEIVDIEERKTIKVSKTIVTTKTNQRSNIVKTNERNRKPRKKDGPTVAPWRPSAGKPEDTHFEKFEKVLKKKREAQRRSRSATSGSRIKLPGHLSSSQTNFAQPSQKDDDGEENNEKTSTSLTTYQRRPSKSKKFEKFDDQETTIAGDTNEERNLTKTKNDLLYETTDTLSPLQHNHNYSAWSYTEVFSDEEYG